MNPSVTAFRWVPPGAQGLVRDLRVRWAFEEAGRPYDVRLVTLGEEQKSSDYRRLQPFGQVPALEADGVTLFESGAIVLHIAKQSEALMPNEEPARELVTTWMFAALNTVEPPIAMLNFLGFVEPRDEPPSKARQAVAGWAGKQLDNLAAFLGDRLYLVGDRFTAADLLMGSVLRILRTTKLESRPKLDAYRDRCEARPAFQRALDAQLRTFAENEPQRG